MFVGSAPGPIAACIVTAIHPYVDANRVERHEPIRRSAVERAAARGGHAFHEEHHRR